jgi:hypothetical protein
MANTTIMFNPNSDMDRAVHPLRNFLEDEFIAFQISNATWGKLGCLNDPYKIPHQQHWIMLQSLYKENLEVPKIKEEIEI